MISPSTIDPLALPSVAISEKKQLPESPCIYFAIDSCDQIQYIGRSVNPRQRWQNHHRQAQLIGCRIAYMPCDAALLDEIETALIEWFSPGLNRTQSSIQRPGYITVVKTVVAQVQGLSENIKKARIEKTQSGVSMTSIAAAAQMSVQNWHQIEKGGQSLPIETLQLMEKALGVNFGVSFDGPPAAADQYKH
jgi:hypothetical protein